ncbi:substrate-binding domain-containing protein [Aquabacterium humicola]|uniref:substrate-binding domain-containing protein n=1 Tax=Aquabacterium humicola TaxID=3237377 RepID=UPI00254341E5|nr:substrate-binding domain-containing protein [Rubrivivax pictus]
MKSTAARGAARLRRSLVCATLLAAAVHAHADYRGVSRSFLWNPSFNELADTARFKKDGPYTIGFANASQGDLWLVAFTHGVQWSAAQNKSKIKRLIVTDANGNAAKQINDIQDLVNQKIDLLIVNPAAADPLDPVLQRVMKQGIPVITVARRPKSDSSFVSFVTASDQALARLNATWLAEKLGGKGNIVLLPGLAGASPAEMRLKAAREVFAMFPDIKILDTQYTGWSPATGKTVTAAMIQKHGKSIQGVWADSGLQGSGAVEAFLAAGWAGSTVPPITGGDLNRMYKLAFEHKFPYVGIDYTPSMGIKAVETALDVLQGVSVPKTLSINFQIVTADNDDTLSVRGDTRLKNYVQMAAPDDLIMGHGMGPNYNPKTFKVDLPQ